MNKILFPQQAKYIESFRNEKDPLILEMEEYAKKYNVPILSQDSAEFMEQLIIIHSPKRVLEIGTAIAYSSIRIAKNLKKKGIVHTIEKSQENAEKAKEFIDKSEYGNKIKIMTGDAFNILPQLDKKYDFVFLDADKEDYKRLFDYCLVLLKRGGIIFVDNLLWHAYAAVKKVPANYKASTNYIREFNIIFTSQPALKTTILPIGDGIGLGVKI